LKSPSHGGFRIASLATHQEDGGATWFEQTRVSMRRDFVLMISAARHCEPPKTTCGDSALTPPAPAPLNRLRQQWRQGSPTFGAIATIPSIQTVQIMAQSLDWIIVDL
jgi:hypothetical protein